MKKIPWKKNRKTPLPLVTDGSLRLFFVGAGSAFTKINNQTNLLIVKGKDHLLIDCGTKCPQAVWELGLHISAINNLLITHSHADHIGGLEECALMGRYFSKKKPSIVITEEYQKILWEMSLKGGIAFGELVNGRCLEFDDLFEIIRPVPVSDFSRQAWRAKVGSIELVLLRTRHIPDSAKTWQDAFFSVGAVIDGRVFFTSDTQYDPELVNEVNDKFKLEAIFHDCQFFTAGVHASLDELSRLPAELKKKMFLSHYGDNFADFEGKINKSGFAGLARERMFYEF